MKSMLTLLLIAGLSWCQLASADPKEAVIKVLDQLPNGDTSAGFSAWINDGSKQSFALGEEVTFNFKAEEPVHVSIAYVDSQGILSLLQPQFGSGNELPGGIVSTFPPPNSGMSIRIEPPLGTERIYFVASREAIDQSVFELEQNTGGVEQPVFQAEDSIKLANMFINSVVDSNASSQVATVVLDNAITSGTRGVEYTTSEIVNFFSKRGTRAITRPKLDANIRFESNSAVLSEEAKANLDVWGESFIHPYLKESSFQIGGHTDDVGAEDYNLDLSKKRAESVRTYLSSKFDIDASRLDIVGHGEFQPKVKDTSSEARAANRRVEFRQLND